MVVTANEPANREENLFLTSNHEDMIEIIYLLLISELDSSSSSVDFSSISSSSASQSGSTDSGNFGMDMSAESSDDSGIERHGTYITHESH